MNRSTRLTEVIVALDPSTVRSVGLQPGTFVTAAFDGPEIANVAELPNEALQANDQVWLVEGNQLRLSSGVRVVLRGRDTTLVTGLGNGVRIALGTIAGAVDGLQVRVESVAPPASSAASLVEGAGE